MSPGRVACSTSADFVHRRGAVLVLLVVLALLARLDIKPAPTASAQVPAPLAIGTELQRPRPVPSVPLIDEHGKPFSLAWRGKWVILAPSMTLCHEVCPLTTGALMELVNDVSLAGLSRQVVIAEATVDPWRDSPFRLRAYQKLTGANFAMLTGTQSEIGRLWKFFGVYYTRVPQGKPPDIDWLTHKPETFDVQHTDAIFFIDPAGQERIVDEGMPEVNGQLSPVLKSLLSDQGLQNLEHPQLPWTAAEALDDLYFLMNRNVPAGAVPKVAAPTAADARRVLAGSPGSLAALHTQAGQLITAGGTLSDRCARCAAIRSFSTRGRRGARRAGRSSRCWPTRRRSSGGRSRSSVPTPTIPRATPGRSCRRTRSATRATRSRRPTCHRSRCWRGCRRRSSSTRAGKVVFVHTGQYESQAALDNDIQHYAVGGQPE